MPIAQSRCRGVECATVVAMTHRYRVCLPVAHAIHIRSDGGALERVEAGLFVGRAEDLGGLFLLVYPELIWPRILPVLRDRGYYLAGSPGSIYCARRGGVEIRSADPILADDPVSLEHASDLVALAVRLGGRGVPRSLSELLIDWLDLIPDMQPCDAPARAIQRIVRYDAREDRIAVYDLCAAYGGVAAHCGLPHGPRRTVRFGLPVRGTVEMVDCTVTDRSSRGIVPRRGRYAPGEFRTVLATPLLDALPADTITVRRIHAAYRWTRYDAGPLVRYAWGRRIRAQSVHEASIWRAALHSVLGLLGQRAHTYHYQWGVPRGSLTNWHPIDLASGLWARRIRRVPRIGHPWAHAWLRQCAQIPLARHHDRALRVYVDSIATTDTLATGHGPGAWREVATGQIWHATGPGSCRLSTQDGEITWEVGRKKRVKIVLDSTGEA